MNCFVELFLSELLVFDSLIRIWVCYDVSGVGGPSGSTCMTFDTWDWREFHCWPCMTRG